MRWRRLYRRGRVTVAEERFELVGREVSERDLQKRKGLVWSQVRRVGSPWLTTSPNSQLT